MFGFFRKKKMTPAIDYETHYEKTDNNVAICIHRIGYRMFYDSEWTVRVTVLDDAGNALDIVDCRLIRDYNESAVALEERVRALGLPVSMASIKTLDEFGSIYYD